MTVLLTACPVCGSPWSPREAARYAATQTTPPVGVAPSGPPAVDPAVAEEPAGGVPDRAYVRTEPGRRFGQSQVRGISVGAISGPVAAGESVEEVAGNFGLTRAEVLVACWYVTEHGGHRWWREWAEASYVLLGSGRYDEVPDPPVDGGR